MNSWQDTEIENGFHSLMIFCTDTHLLCLHFTGTSLLTHLVSSTIPSDTNQFGMDYQQSFCSHFIQSCHWESSCMKSTNQLRAPSKVKIGCCLLQEKYSSFVQMVWSKPLCGRLTLQHNYMLDISSWPEQMMKQLKDHGKMFCLIKTSGGKSLSIHSHMLLKNWPTGTARNSQFLKSLKQKKQQRKEKCSSNELTLIWESVIWFCKAIQLL